MKITDFQRKKERREKISMLTCYDYPSARMIADTSIDCILVGDTLAMVVHGFANTTFATMDMMVLHTEAVARGKGLQLLVCDLPFLCHRFSRAQTVENCKRLLLAGAAAIKIEGADADTCQTIAYLVQAGLPIMGHIGLTPQSIYQLGQYKVQGKQAAEAQQLIDQAHALQAAGCFAVVIECVPESLAKTISRALTIPTIGIGAGIETDGQVLVWHDMLGLQDEMHPKFVKQYIQLKPSIQAAINHYAQQVVALQFPSKEHAYL